MGNSSPHGVMPSLPIYHQLRLQARWA